MGPICVNAVAFAGGLHAGGPAVVFGAGPVGLITSQIVRATGADLIAHESQTVKITRQGSVTTTDDLQAKALFHITINAQGEVTAEVSKFEFVCK